MIEMRASLSAPAAAGTPPSRVAPALCPIAFRVHSATPAAAPIRKTLRCMAGILTNDSVRLRGYDFANHSVALAENVKFAFIVDAEVNVGAAARDLTVSRVSRRFSPALTTFAVEAGIVNRLLQ